jgi:hypothetical protein
MSTCCVLLLFLLLLLVPCAGHIVREDLERKVSRSPNDTKEMEKNPPLRGQWETNLLVWNRSLGMGGKLGRARRCLLFGWLAALLVGDWDTDEIR